MTKGSSLVGIWIFLLAAAASAGQWQLDKQNSRLLFVFEQAGSDEQGGFTASTRT